jgi:hypothetical protein
MNWYSTDSRKASPMPPCQPARPTPLSTALARFCTSSFSIFDMVMIGMIRLRSRIEGSAKASVVFST